MQLVRIIFFGVLIIFSFSGCKKNDIKIAAKFTKSIVKTNKQTIRAIAKNNKTLISWTVKNNLILKAHKNPGISDILNKKGNVLGTVSTVGSKSVITTFSLSARKTVNELLDKNALPNAIYKVDNQIFTTDHRSRTVNAYISSIPSNVVNRNEISNSYEQLKSVRKGGLKGVHHGGHLIGHSLGGNSGLINIAPQLVKLNIGAYGKIEKFVRINKKGIKNYNIKVFYKGESQIPTRFVQSFEFRGEQNLLVQLKNNNKSFYFLKKSDVNDRPYFSCIIFHSNGFH